MHNTFACLTLAGSQTLYSPVKYMKGGQRVASNGIVEGLGMRLV